MADNGVKSTDLTNASLLDEVIGNRDGSTVAATMFTLAQQLLGSGPLADAIALDGQAHWRSTLANLNTVTGQTGDNGFVVNDGANNGVYRWSGSAWAKVSVLPGALGFQNLQDVSPNDMPVSTAQAAAIAPIEKNADVAYASANGGEVEVLENGNAALAGGTTGNTYYWSTDPSGLPSRSRLRQVRVGSNAATTGELLIVDAAMRVINAFPFSVTGSGIFDITPVGDIIAPAGSRLYLKPDTTSIIRSGTGTGGARFPVTVYSGVVGDHVTGVEATSASVAFEATWDVFANTDLVQQSANVQARLASVEGKALEAVSTAPLANEEWLRGTPNIYGIQGAADAAVELAVGSVVNSFSATVSVGSGTNGLRLIVAKRIISAGDTQLDFMTLAPIQTIERTPAALGLTVGAATATKVKIPVDPFEIEAGYSYFYLLQGLDASMNGVPLGVGRHTLINDARQRRRGWFCATGGPNPLYPTLYTAIGPNTIIAAGFNSTKALVATSGPATVVPTASEAVTKAAATVAGATITVSADVMRIGVLATYSGSPTFTLTASGSVRYDVIYFNAQTNAIAVMAGSPRTTDPGEAVPILANSQFIPLFHVRVTSATVEALPVWEQIDGDAISLIPRLEGERRRSKRMMPKTLAKIARGVPVKFVCVGDSITALQNGNPSAATPNGALRDRPEFFSSGIGSDIVAALTRYTSVQLGNADDGAGAVHVAASHVWRAVLAMRAAGITVNYDNFAIAGTTTAALVSGSPLSATAWFNAALALSPDLLIVNMGMNDTVPATMEANLAAIITIAKAAGVEVLLCGVIREAPAAFNGTRWRGNNYAIERAAKHHGAAFVPTLQMYEDGYLGVMGVTKEDVSSADTFHHPGIREYNRIGLELLKTIAE